MEFTSDPTVGAYSPLWLPTQVEVVDRLTARITTEKTSPRS